MIRFLPLLALLLAAALAGCDSGVDGEAGANRPPDTALAVRDSSLVGDIDDDDRFTSTLFVSWSGTDPDGFVTAYDLRFYAEGETPGPEEAWTRTAESDSLVLLPIPPASQTANVVFEVRAVDDAGAVDPDPARTVFPIRNSPPTFRLSGTLVPADTTWPVVSFGWTATDPDGQASLAAVEISLNDSLSFVALPPEVDFVTLVAVDPRAEGPTDAEVFFGTNFVPSGLVVPDFRLDADNVFYARAVDGTGTASVRADFPLDDEAWFVRRPTSEVLLVNDYRRDRDVVIMPFHREVLGSYTSTFDEWDLSEPDATGSSTPTVTSAALPAAASPTLRRTLALWRYIYWVSNAATDRVQSYNLPVAASVSDLFFAGGGRLFVQVPIDLPGNPADASSNAALNILPVGDLITLPDTLTASNLRVSAGDGLTPAQPVPGTGAVLPPLTNVISVTSGLPYLPGANVPLYQADYSIRTGGVTTDWTGPETVASMSADRRVALFAVPFVRISGELLLEGVDGDTGAPAEAIRLILEGLTFPR